MSIGIFFTDTPGAIGTAIFTNYKFKTDTRILK